MSKKFSLNDFIDKAHNIHGDKYDYSKVEYINSQTKICIVCPEHGEFWQAPNNHINQKQGCPKCTHRSFKLTFQEFVVNARKIHGDKYDYSKVDYINNRTKVCIICPEHGEFWQTPYKHISGQGCPKCKGKNKTTKDFIKEAKEIHGNKYDYSKVEYINSDTKVCIICPEHGEFWQTPHSHLSGSSCFKCSKNLKLNKHSFIDKARNIHGDRYDYSKVEYVNNKTKVCIICPEHGEFWQAPQNHINQKQGCSKCSEKTNLSENKVFEFIKDNTNYEVEQQKKFKWLGQKRIDIFINELNIGIEYQGRQHFQPIEYYGGIDEYENIKRRDSEKYYQCKKHGIKIIYVSYEKNIPPKYIDNIITNNNDLLKEIKKYDKSNR